MNDAGDLARMLAAQAPALVAELLPAGKREGAEWRCGSLAGEPGRSLAVRIHGARAGVWSDFASGEAGDALDLVAAVRYRGDRRDAMAWARSWLGLGDSAVPAQHQREAPARPPPGEDEEAARRRAVAKRIFLQGQVSLLGTPAAAYLAGRGIDLAELGRQPRSLRYHPALANRESGCDWPALLAAVTNAAGEHVATHRTWLGCIGGRWRKADLRDPKMSIGSVAGGTIRLWRGAGGRPLGKAAEGESVVIGEGIETCLSVVIACPELRVLCAVSLANMARIELPPAIRTVILCADNDGDNDAAARGLQRAVDHFTGQGRAVRIARSPFGNDMNDALTAGFDGET